MRNVLQILALIIIITALTALQLDAMEGIQRPFTRLPNAVNFGPTGARLWATYVSEEPGMEGSFEFIHKVNAPKLYSIRLSVNGKDAPLVYESHRWYPSHMEMEFRASDIRLSENKFITWDDCAVDVITVRNDSDAAAIIRLDMEYGAPRDAAASGPDWEFTVHNETVYVKSSLNGSKEARLESGESARWTAGAALDLTENGAEETLKRWMSYVEPSAVQVREYESFFDDAPVFRCSDQALEKMWQYRWYLVRRNMSDPRYGRLTHPLFYEGRSAKMTLDPWKPQGWEFSKLIPFSTPFHLLEGRWKGDASACKGEILTLVENQGEDGLFKCVYVDGIGGNYTDFIGWSVWQLYLVHPDREWLAKVGPAVVKQVDGTLREYDEDGDFLPEVKNHNSTGKEYQPSFFLREGYPDNPRVVHGTPLERVDAACYLYLNARAAAEIMTEIGDGKEAVRMARAGQQVKSAILKYMWDPEKKFFYDIDAKEHDRILVENVVGFDPFFAGIAGDEHGDAFDRLADPEQFWTAAPVPSTTKQCPVYAPNASWKGVHLKGEHGAMWNGPTWPFTDSTALMGLGNASQRSNHRFDGLFAELLKRYTKMCFRNGDINDPMIYEHYNPETGQPISEEEDYYHSSWIDLVVRYLAGITPGKGGEVEFHPVDCGLDWFSLSGVEMAGRSVDVEYNREGGYTGKVDGVVASHRASISD